MREVFDNIFEGIMVFEKNGTVSYLNESAANILKKNAEDIIGRNFVACFSGQGDNDDFVQAVLDAIYEPEKPHESNFVYHAKDAAVHLYMNTTCIKENSLKVVAVLTDVSELLELENVDIRLAKVQEKQKILKMQDEMLTKSFSRYLDDNLIREILDKKDGMQFSAHRQQVTLLILDCSVLKESALKMEPSRYLDMVNHAMGCIISILKEHNGTIFELHCDMSACMFGAPQKSVEHADEAVKAALKIRAQIPEINRYCKENGYPSVDFTIAIHSGEMMLGNLGSANMAKYSPIGTPVNLTARMLFSARQGEIAISPMTRQCLSIPVRTDREYQVITKGMREPVTVSTICDYPEGLADGQ